MSGPFAGTELPKKKTLEISSDESDKGMVRYVTEAAFGNVRMSTGCKETQPRDQRVGPFGPTPNLGEGKGAESGIRCQWLVLFISHSCVMKPP